MPPTNSRSRNSNSKSRKKTLRKNLWDRDSLRSLSTIRPHNTSDASELRANNQYKVPYTPDINSGMAKLVVPFDVSKCFNNLEDYEDPTNLNYDFKHSKLMRASRMAAGQELYKDNPKCVVAILRKRGHKGGRYTKSNKKKTIRRKRR